MIDVVDFVLTAVLVSLIWIIITMILWQYAKVKGGQEALKYPNFVYPSLSEITILGKYQMPARSSQEIQEELRQYLPVTDYVVASTPNNIRIFNRRGSLDPKKEYFKKLQTTRDGVPDQLFLQISRERENIQLVNATCIPIMARKLGQQVQFLFPKQSVEDAQLQCRLFMDRIMSTIGAETLVPPYAESSVLKLRKLEFLFNTLKENRINERVHEMMIGSRQRIYVTGWIDREILGDLENAKSRNVEVRIITKDPAGSDRLVKQDFKRLITEMGFKNIKLSPRFHDRFLICDESCLIGSPYFTTASKTRFESALFTDDSNIVNSLVSHFELIWNEKDSVNPRTSKKDLSREKKTTKNSSTSIR